MAKGKNYTEEKYLTMQSSVKTLALKFYMEQITTGRIEDIIEDIHGIDPDEYEVIGIVHNRDTKTDDLFEPSIEKPHVHVIIRITCRPFKKITPVKVRTILNLFPHLHYRLSHKNKDGEIEEGEDDELWKKKGVTTVGDFAEYATYLTHDTEKAIADGKAHYEMDELFSNLSPGVIVQIRDGYRVYSDGGSKRSYKEMADLDAYAYQLGYNLGDYDTWYDSLAYGIRKNAGFKTIKESYYRGSQKRLKEHEEIPRLCVYIEGPPSSGKTATSIACLKGSGAEVLDASGQGTGRYDRLTPHTDAIIISDDVSANLLNLADQYMCNVYKRGSNNPIWCGHYFIVTQNISIDEWAGKCGFKNTEQVDALKSRFFICKISEHDKSANTLECVTPMKRKPSHYKDLLKMFDDFKASFDASSAAFFQSRIDKFTQTDELWDTSSTPVRIAKTVKIELPSESKAKKIAEEKRAAAEKKLKEAENLESLKKTVSDAHDANLRIVADYRSRLESEGMARLLESLPSESSDLYMYEMHDHISRVRDKGVLDNVTLPDIKKELQLDILQHKPKEHIYDAQHYLSYPIRRAAFDDLSHAGIIAEDLFVEELPFS